MSVVVEFCDKTFVPLNVYSQSNIFMLCIRFKPELKRDYPLNLSISFSGGKETN